MTHVQTLQARFDAQRRAFAAEPWPDLALRRDRLARLATMTRRHREEISRAIAEDFGHRAEAESRLAEVATVLQAIRHAKRHLRRWMRPRRAAVPWRLKPGRARVHRQPLGVVGIIAPFNYPWNLALLPAVDRSEEHTSELQSRPHLVCRLLLEKKKKKVTNCNTLYT